MTVHLKTPLCQADAASGSLSSQSFKVVLQRFAEYLGGGQEPLDS